MTRDEAILTFMRTEGNSVAAGHGPTEEQLREANEVLGWFDVSEDGKFHFKAKK